jgi:hypothetical protein
MQNYIETKYNIKVRYINTMSNSVNGHGIYLDRDIFFKKINNHDGLNEFRGYNLLKYELKCFEMVDFKIDNTDESLIIYDFDHSLRHNGGLLVDDLSNHLALKETINKIIKYLKNLMDIKLYTYPEDPLFSERFYRINKWYKKNCFKYFTIFGLTHDFNEILSLAADTIYQIYYSNPKILECILGHGDINELNISSEATFYDFAYSGINSLYSEFVIGYCSIAFGNYFDMIYHIKSYNRHIKSILSNHTRYIVKYSFDMLSDLFVIDYFKIIISKGRQLFLTEFSNLFINSITNYNLVKSMLIFRLLTVRNINQFEKTDYVCIIVLCILIYRTNSLEELNYLLIEK